MAVYGKNLYPPIVDTYMPSFYYGEENNLIIPFSVSEYNNVDDIKQIHITVSYQSGGNVLNTSLEVAVVDFNKEKNNDGKYTVAIANTDFKENIFNQEQWYKIQLRFSTVSLGSLNLTAAWLNDNINNFSEWSEVCLMKAIHKPTLEIFTNKKLNEKSNDEEDKNNYIINYLNSEYLSFIGYLKFYNNNIEVNSTEYLKEYQVKLSAYSNFTFDKNNDGVFDTEIKEGFVFFESDKVQVNKFDINYFSYNLPYHLKTPQTLESVDGAPFLLSKAPYLLEVFWTTSNGYEGVNKYLININTFNISKDDAVTIEAYARNECGRIEVPFEISEYDLLNVVKEYNFVIQRTSFKEPNKDSDFLNEYWEDIYAGYFTSDDEYSKEVYETGATTPMLVRYYKKTFYDYTAESGVWYKYNFQFRENNTTRFQNNESNVAMLSLDDIFLVDKDRALKVKFDPNISNFKRNILESKVDTIGAKYPYIVKNGNVDYKQFSLSGLISCEMDDVRIFAKNDEDILGENLTYYNDYNLGSDDLSVFRYKKQKNILGNNFFPRTRGQNDYIYERFFREKVMDFLYDGKAKLFKSETEGNVLVRLMDISLTPNQTLGRLIYSFSATAYEVAESIISNYLKYDILDGMSEYVEDIPKKYATTQGKLEFSFSLNAKTEKDLIEEIINTLELDVSVSDLKINKFSINFTSRPYLIAAASLGASSAGSDLLGYHLFVSQNSISKNILVSPYRQYSLQGERDAQINSLKIKAPNNEDVLIEGVLNYDASYLPKEGDGEITYKTIGYGYAPSQLKEDNFDTGNTNDLIKNIKEKSIDSLYSVNNIQKPTNIIFTIEQIENINIEINPGTILSVKMKKTNSTDSSSFEIVVDKTGFLSYENNGDVFESFSIDGVQLSKSLDSNREARDYEFIDKRDEEYPINPVRNGLYKDFESETGFSIFYQGKEYDAILNNNTVIFHPKVSFLMNYTYLYLQQDKESE